MDLDDDTVWDDEIVVPADQRLLLSQLSALRPPAPTVASGTMTSSSSGSMGTGSAAVAAAAGANGAAGFGGTKPKPFKPSKIPGWGDTQVIDELTPSASASFGLDALPPPPSAEVPAQLAPFADAGVLVR